MKHKTPLGAVRGLGSAKKGSGHWWAQRVSAVAMLPLGLWLIFSLARLAHVDMINFSALQHWASIPLNAMLLIATIVVACYHSQLGVEVVLEDYAEKGASRVVALTLQKFLHIAAAVIGVYSVLKISFGA